LNRTVSCSLAAALLALLIIFTGTACTVPLAPGYRILKESRQVKFVQGPVPELQIRGNFTLENTGNGDLKFIDIVFPEDRAFGRKNLRVHIAGRDAALSQLPEEYQQGSPNTLRIALDPPWTRREKRELVIEYSLSSPEDAGSRITLGDSSFHLGYRGWFPILQPPRHALAPFPKRPDKTIVAIRLPDNYLVLSRGTPAGRKKDGGEIEHRFLLRQNDLAPYVVAGRYAVSSPNQKSSSGMFWTLQPLKDDPAPAEARITALWATLQTEFGPLDKNIRAPHIVESPELRAHLDGEGGAAAAFFPGGALVNSQALALGVGSDVFLEMVAHALAHNWFGEELYFSSLAALGLSEGLPDYATVVIDEARAGESARRQRILKFLREYDEARKQGAESPLGVTTMGDPPLQGRIARAKAPLFLVALEDSYGEATVRAGLKNLLNTLRGQEVGYDEVRSALEQSTGKNLAEPFRVWLYDKGIPQDFRARYENAIESRP
jgi:Peptidase family M1 domain